VTIDSDDLEMRKRPGALVLLDGAANVDAELRLLHARRDVGVRLGIDVGIDAQRNRRFAADRRRHLVEQIELGSGFDVEGENALAQGVRHLVARLADAREHDRSRVGSRPPGAEQLAPRDDVEPTTFASEETQHREVRVRFDRVAHEVWRRGERFVEDVVVATQRRRAVDVARGADFGRNLLERYVLGAELAGLIGEVIHQSSVTATMLEGWL
jgi:hypothetical protein